jgi:hypothetical protein
MSRQKSRDALHIPTSALYDFAALNRRKDQENGTQPIIIELRNLLTILFLFARLLVKNKKGATCGNRTLFFCDKRGRVEGMRQDSASPRSKPGNSNLGNLRFEVARF